jgi:hypothetical protein
MMSAAMTSFLITLGFLLGCRGDRIEVIGYQGYDVTRGAEFLGQSWMTNALIKINTTNAKNGWAGWPFRATEYFWESHVVKVRMRVCLGTQVGALFDSYTKGPFP